MKRCLLLANRNFFKKNSGHEVALYAYCKELYDKYGYAIDIVLKKTEGNIEKPYFIDNIYYFPQFGKVSLLTNCVKNFINGNPLQFSIFVNGLNKTFVKELVEHNGYQLVFVDMIRMAPFADSVTMVPCKVLILEDLLAKRYKAMIEGNSQGSVMGYYANKVPNFVNRIVDSRLFKKVLLRYEYSSVEKAEARYAKKYDYLTFVAQEEADFFNKKNRVSNALKLGLGVDYNYFASTVRNNNDCDNILVYMGNMNVAANQDSVRFIVSQVLPLIKHKVIFKIIGSFPKHLEKELGNESVEFMGRVEDIRDVIGRAKVFLAPIAYGSGIKTKVIEAMAMGIPVVTNSVGEENIYAKNGEDYYVFDLPHEIAASVDRLINDNELNVKMGLSGQKFIKDNFTWESVLQNFSKMCI